MTKTTTEERLAVVETKLDNIGKGISRIEEKLDQLPEQYATKQEHNNLRDVVHTTNKYLIGSIITIITGLLIWYFTR